MWHPEIVPSPLEGTQGGKSGTASLALGAQAEDSLCGQTADREDKKLSFTGGRVANETVGGKTIQKWQNVQRKDPCLSLLAKTRSDSGTIAVFLPQITLYCLAELRNN